MLRESLGGWNLAVQRVWNPRIRKFRDSQSRDASDHRFRLRFLTRKPRRWRTPGGAEHELASEALSQEEDSMHVY